MLQYQNLSQTDISLFEKVYLPMKANSRIIFSEEFFSFQMTTWEYFQLIAKYLPLQLNEM